MNSFITTDIICYLRKRISLTTLDTVVALYPTNPPDIGDNDRILSHKLNLSSEQEIKDFCVWINKDFERITLIHAAALSRD